MSRPQTFTSEQLLDAACVVAGRHGRAASVELVAVELGVSAGSVYHRTGTKRALFAQLWLRSLARFHARLLTALRSSSDAEAALIAGAGEVIKYCRDQRAEARSLTLFRWLDLVADTPPALIDEVERANDEVMAEILGLAGRRFDTASPDQQAIVMTAVQQVPYALVRSLLDSPDTAIPSWMDAAIAAAVPAMLAVGDRTHPKDP